MEPTADPLLDFCTAPAWRPRGLQSPYWTAEVYGFGRHIRRYGYFPTFLPLCVYTDHGPGPIDAPYPHELESDAPTQLYHSPEAAALWKKVSRKPCSVLYSPFVFYRRQAGITQSPTARGTIAFPAHTTEVIDEVSDLEAYGRQLMALPARFQPVSVCLHMHDVKRGRHHVFEKLGLPVLSAGNARDWRFTERFYDLIKDFRYGTSNCVGSYLFYCVELGLPFSLYGNEQTFINTGDPNVPAGAYDPTHMPWYRATYDRFAGLNDQISPEQRAFVELHLGIADGVGRGQMTWILYRSFLTWLVRRKSQKYIFEMISEKAKSLFPAR